MWDLSSDKLVCDRHGITCDEKKGDEPEGPVADIVLDGNKLIGSIPPEVWTLMCYNIESDSLRQRTTLANSNNITFFDSEGWRTMHRNILVSFLESPVL